MGRRLRRYSPRGIVPGKDKKRARLNCIDHLLTLFPYEELAQEEIELPERVYNSDYERSAMPPELYLPTKY